MFPVQHFFFLSLTIITCYAEHPGYSYQQPDPVAVNPFAAFAAQPAALYGAPQQFAGHQQPSTNYIPPVNEGYNKEFYTFAAPEEEFEDLHAAERIATAFQKNLRVIFIKSPENRGLEHAALALAKQASDDKTAIYVLNKQADVGELANRLNTIRDQHAHKPEVHFVKYRTPEEGAYAQQYIQAHYDTLRGATRNSNGGVAQVLNFASKATPAVAQGAAYTGAVGGAASSSSFGGYGDYFAQGGSVAAGIEGEQGASGYVVGPVGSSAGVGAAAGLGAGYGGYAVGGVGAGGLGAGGLAATYGADFSGVHDNSAYAGYAYSSGAQVHAEQAVSKINERLHAGGNLVFPTEHSGSNTYLPPVKRRY